MNVNASPVFLNPTNNEKYDISEPCTAVKKLWHFWRAIMYLKKIPFWHLIISTLCSQPYTSHLKEALANIKTVIKIRYTEIKIVCYSRLLFCVCCTFD